MGSATTVMALGGDYDTTRAVDLRAIIGRIEGVDFADFNYTNNKLTVRFDPDLLDPAKLQSVVVEERGHHLSPAVRQGERSGASVGRGGGT